MVVTPAQLLLAIAEHETLEKSRAALQGLTREAAEKLLRGAARQLQQERAPEPKKAAPAHSVIVYSDGAARGNPGPAGAGAVVERSVLGACARIGAVLVNVNPGALQRPRGFLVAHPCSQSVGEESNEMQPGGGR